MPPADPFAVLDAWAQCGWLRSLDRAFARFLHAEHPEAAAAVLLAAALASHQLGRGHICLDLAAVLEDPAATLALPPEGQGGAEGLAPPAEILAGLTPGGWEAELVRSPIVGAGEGATPLVLERGRLYLRRYWGYARRVAEGIGARLQVPPPMPSDLAPRLQRLFGPLRNPAEAAGTEIHDQSLAAALAASSAFSVICGGPGSGKTTTVVRLLALLQELALEGGRPLRIGLAAPTGKAAARLGETMARAAEALPAAVRGALPAAVVTLHHLLGARPDTRHFARRRRNPLHLDLLVIDEASMVDLELMAAVLEALPGEARLILLGDKDQLASVEAGSVLGDICRRADGSRYRPQTIARLASATGQRLDRLAGEGALIDQHIALLRRSHRFGVDSGIGALARAVNSGDPLQVAAVWRRGYGDLMQSPLESAAEEGFARLLCDGCAEAGGAAAGEVPGGYRACLERVRAGQRPGESETQWILAVLAALGRFQVLAALRQGPWGVEALNDRAARVLRRAGLIEAHEGWYAGRPVMVTRNDYRLGLMNGDVGIALPLSESHEPRRKSLRVAFAAGGGGLVTVLPSRLREVETVYVTTVHKAQGSEFDHVALVLPAGRPAVVTRELIYTAVTRARRRFTLLGPRPEALAEAAGRPTHRASGLAEMLNRLG
jgi:exodeoxyribonuclease V alpha subunit